MAKYSGVITLVLFVLSGKAHAQFAECDPLNTNEVEIFDSGTEYPSLENFCQSPPPPRLATQNACPQLGDQFVMYSDAAVLSDGSIQAFATSEDLSPYSATADVQVTSTVTYPNQTSTGMAGFSRNGYVLASASVAFDENNVGDMTISSQHELNWPGCDGYGIIVPSTKTVRIGATIQWYSLSGMVAPSVYAYVSMDPNCSTKSVCGNPGIFTDNTDIGYIKEFIPWISFNGSPAPYGTGTAYCAKGGAVIRSEKAPGPPYCFDIGMK